MGGSSARQALALVGLYAAACVAAYFFLRWYHPDAGKWAAALLAIPITMTAGYVVAARQHLQEGRLVLDAARQTIFRDGERVVVAGPITPLGEALKSPFRGQDSVAYRYVIDHVVTSLDGPRSRRRDYWGMALCPCAIETPSGPVRILGWPSLETLIDTLEDKTPADVYVRSTSFRHPLSDVERFGSLDEPFATESDTFLDDVCGDSGHAGGRGFRELPDFTGRDVFEARVEVGQVVCAAGVYSAARKALLPSGEGVKRLRLSTFSPELWASENKDSAYMYLRWGAVFGVVAVAAALASRWC